jgi:uncharacterized sodium:solute symporter family permease YidK
LFTGIIAFVAWRQSRRTRIETLSAFFLAGRSLGFLVVGGGLLFANINTATIVGENEQVYTNNMSVMAWGITSVLAMLVVSEFFMPIYLRTGIATTPEYLTKRYDSSTGRLVSVIFLISYVVNLLPTVLYGGAVAFNGLFHLSEHWRIGYWPTIWILVWIMGATGCLYSVLGGLRAIAVSDTLLGMGIFVGGILCGTWGLVGRITYGVGQPPGSFEQHRRTGGPGPFPGAFYGNAVGQPLLLGYGTIYCATGTGFTRSEDLSARDCRGLSGQAGVPIAVEYSGVDRRAGVPTAA